MITLIKYFIYVLIVEAVVFLASIAVTLLVYMNVLTDDILDRLIDIDIAVSIILLLVPMVYGLIKIITLPL